MSEKPATIFKYERLSMLSLQNLKRQSFYFARPTQFNDPYDCTITANIDDRTDEEVEKLRAHFLLDSSHPAEVRRQLQAMGRSDLRGHMVNWVRNVIDKEVERFVVQNGVTCFS